MTDRQQLAYMTSRRIEPPGPEAALSEGIARFLLHLEHDGAAERSLAVYRMTAWSLVEFLERDPALGELDRDTAGEWLHWLDNTFSYRRGRGAYPKWFSPAEVADFLARDVPKAMREKSRSKATIDNYRTWGGHLLRWLGVHVDLDRRKRRKGWRPPLVPEIDEIAVRWQAALIRRPSRPRTATRSF